ncbi:hypothetical protein M3147_00955 [Agromyces mediolanus]|uniref:hypothetical protein n=1 Tax=Agromyces mediolanus TaxID=41986 RepID=UPI00203D2EBD|nr:hypothetical protein [Agromyces mediolanus]MCM3655817.1 hypothetical protein [Agromyces mediolanus]
MDTSEAEGGRVGIVLIWLIALAGSVLVVALAYGGQRVWFGDTSALGVYRALGVVFAASVLGALLVQLATRRPVGYVARASASVGGAAVLIALAAAAVAPLAVGLSG